MKDIKVCYSVRDEFGREEDVFSLHKDALKWLKEHGQTWKQYDIITTVLVCPKGYLEKLKQQLEKELEEK